MSKVRKGEGGGGGDVRARGEMKGLLEAEVVSGKEGAGRTGKGEQSIPSLRLLTSHLTW